MVTTQDTSSLVRQGSAGASASARITTAMGAREAITAQAQRRSFGFGEDHNLGVLSEVLADVWQLEFDKATQSLDNDAARRLLDLADPQGRPTDRSTTDNAWETGVESSSRHAATADLPGFLHGG